MRLNIPTTNDRLLLIKDWSFTMLYDYRNALLMQAFGKNYGYGENKNVKIKALFKKGFMLNLERLVLPRKKTQFSSPGQTDFGYMSFMVEVPKEKRKQHPGIHGQTLYMKIEDCNFDYKKIEPRVIEKRNISGTEIKLTGQHIRYQNDTYQLELNRDDARDLDSLRYVEFRAMQRKITVNGINKTLGERLLNNLACQENHYELRNMNQNLKTPYHERPVLFTIEVYRTITDIEMDKATIFNDNVKYTFTVKTDFLLKDQLGLEIGRFNQRDITRLINAAKKHLKSKK